MWWPFRRKKVRLREIGESEAYGRTYGERTAEVRVVAKIERRPRYRLLLTGEEIRRQFEEKLLRRGEKEKGG